MQVFLQRHYAWINKFGFKKISFHASSRLSEAGSHMVENENSS